MVAMSRMPPPSCAGMVIASRMASTASPLTGLPAKAPFRVDDVEVGEALRLEGARLRGRVVVEHGRAAHLAVLQAHALAVFQVDGGKQDQWRLRVCWRRLRAGTLAIRSLTLLAIEKSRTGEVKAGGNVRYALASQFPKFVGQQLSIMGSRYTSRPRRLSESVRSPRTDAVDIWIARWLRIFAAATSSPATAATRAASTRSGRRLVFQARAPRARSCSRRATRSCRTASISGPTGGFRAASHPDQLSALRIALGTSFGLDFCLNGENSPEHDENKRWTIPMIRGMFSLRSDAANAAQSGVSLSVSPP